MSDTLVGGCTVMIGIVSISIAFIAIIIIIIRRKERSSHSEWISWKRR